MYKRQTQLSVTLEVANTGDTPFAFTAALHTYLRVADIANVTIEGLQGCDYEDSANGGTLHREHNYEAVSYTHLDVYKRQLFGSTRSVFLKLSYGWQP